jgi:pyruvate/2-oxoglutarate dehydrogenase complex dihydrolipoamide acyltransferase (E2) component
VAFDMEVPTPKLTFKALAFITEDMYAQAKEIAETDLVKSIIGSIFGTGEQEPAAAPAPAPAAAPAKAVAAPKPAAATKAKANGNGAAAAPAVAAPVAPPVTPDVANMNVDLNLSNLSFDD